jgi:hypothetical protein
MELTITFTAGDGNGKRVQYRTDEKTWAELEKAQHSKELFGFIMQVGIHTGCIIRV